MFPEGHEAVMEHFDPFKPGAFSLAMSEGVPIVPIVLDGTHDALPKTGMTIHSKKSDTLGSCSAAHYAGRLSGIHPRVVG